MSGSYSLRESKWDNGIEGEVFSPLFGQKIQFLAKNCEEEYAARCAEFIENLEHIADFPAFETALTALGEYLSDFLDERGDDFDLGGFALEDGAEGVLKAVLPYELVFEKSEWFDDDDCPIAFSMRLRFKPVPDELMEIAVRGDVPVYVGDYRKVSPWNENILKKKWNYVRELK